MAFLNKFRSKVSSRYTNCSNSTEHTKVLFRIGTYLILTWYNNTQVISNKISIILIIANHNNREYNISERMWFQIFKRHIPSKISWNNCRHITLQKLLHWVQDHITRWHKICIQSLPSNFLVLVSSKLTARIYYILNNSSLRIVGVGNNLSWCSKR